eukprot:Em0021g658a
MASLLEVLTSSGHLTAACLRLVYHVTALCHIGDFQGGECLIYLSVTSIAVCARNGRALGSWPYNVIRDFSCRDGNFSFTSGRRGPFGVGTYQFQLTPSVLTKLSSAITVLTGAQFGPKASSQQELKSSKAATTSFSLIQPWNSSEDQSCTPSISSKSSPSPHPLTDEACGNEVTKPLHSYRSLPELRSSGIVHSSRLHLLKKQMSSPGPVRQRPCHRYEEIDPPDDMTEAAGLPPSTSCTPVMSTNSYTASVLALPYLSSPTGIASISHNAATSPSAAAVPISSTVTEKHGCASTSNTKSADYENIQNGRERKGQNATINIEAGHPESLHQSGVQEPAMPDKAAGVYDCPHRALYSVPTFCRGEVLTLKARHGRAQVPPLIPSKPNVIDVLYCNVQSSKMKPLQRCHSAEETRDGDLYEEMNSIAEHPNQSGGRQNSFPDQHCSGCGLACNAVASVIAQQLAAKEGYELITSMRHPVSHNVEDKLVVSDHCSQSHVGQGRQLYINQNLMSARHPEAD